MSLFIMPAPRVSVFVAIGPTFHHSSATCLYFCYHRTPRLIMPAPRVSVSVAIGPTFHHSSATCLFFCYHRTPRFIMPAPRVSVSVIIGPHVSSFQRHVSLFLLASGPTFHRSSATCLCRYVSSSTRPIYQSK